MEILQSFNINIFLLVSISIRTNELDADMESSMNNGSAGATATSLFGGLGFGGAPKPAEPAKNIFGSPSLFGATANPSGQSPGLGVGQAQQQKSPFGGILKTATFNAAGTTQPSTGLFGSSATASTSGSGGVAGGNLFSAAISGQNTSTAAQGGLFNSFKTPQKSTGFGAPTAFGAAPAFGSGATFGAPAATSFGAAPTFGSGSSIK